MVLWIQIIINCAVLRCTFFTSRACNAFTCTVCMWTRPKASKCQQLRMHAPHCHTASAPAPEGLEQLPMKVHQHRYHTRCGWECSWRYSDTDPQRGIAWSTPDPTRMQSVMHGHYLLTGIGITLSLDRRTQGTARSRPPRRHINRHSTCITCTGWGCIVRRHHNYDITDINEIYRSCMCTVKPGRWSREPGRGQCTPVRKRFADLSQTFLSMQAAMAAWAHLLKLRSWRPCQRPTEPLRGQCLCRCCRRSCPRPIASGSRPSVAASGGLHHTHSWSSCADLVGYA